MGIISLPLQIPTLGKGCGGRGSAKRLMLGGSRGAPRAALIPVSLPTDGALVQPKMSASFVLTTRRSMVLFLDRVYGIESRTSYCMCWTWGFLPDMRAAHKLDTVSSPGHPPASTVEMGHGSLQNSLIWIMRFIN